MSVAGLKKQFHKARQLLSEKISGVEGTKVDDSFVEMERKSWVTNKCVIELTSKTTEYLQPNPASRGKLNMLNSMSKVRGQVKTTGYPQAEGLLGGCMLRYGHQLGLDSSFGCALVDSGEAMKRIAGLKDALDMDIQQNFIDPLHNLKHNDLGEILHHLKKMEGRRLDLDYKKTRQGRKSAEEIQEAVRKFDESKQLAEKSMFNFLENDVEQVILVSALIRAAVDFHRQSHSILEELSIKLKERISSASRRPKNQFKPKSTRSSMETITRKTSASNKSDHMTSIPSLSPGSPTPVEGLHQWEELDQPCCRSLYDFEPLNEGDLALKVGDLIILTNQVDENWFEGMLNGDSGFFPIDYVKVIVPLPQYKVRGAPFRSLHLQK